MVLGRAFTLWEHINKGLDCLSQKIQKNQNAMGGKSLWSTKILKQKKPQQVVDTGEWLPSALGNSEAAGRKW